MKSYFHFNFWSIADESSLMELARRLGNDVRYSKRMVGRKVQSGYPYIATTKKLLNEIAGGGLQEQLRNIECCLKDLELGKHKICLQICIADDESIAGVNFSKETLQLLVKIGAQLDISVGRIAK